MTGKWIWQNGAYLACFLTSTNTLFSRSISLFFKTGRSNALEAGYSWELALIRPLVLSVHASLVEAPVLRAEVNVGYEEQSGQLASLNGTPVKSLRHLKEMVEGITEGRLSFRLDSGEMIVTSAQKCWASEPAIFCTHCIPHRASLDLRGDGLGEEVLGLGSDDILGEPRQLLLPPLYQASLPRVIKLRQYHCLRRMKQVVKGQLW